ncbi:MAG TPA: CDP-alcohol phosphatidyltransferase family protein [bacterium]|nr:CDP-alcohol phosphatidyltransferase family protein [bacterium]
MLKDNPRVIIPNFFTSLNLLIGFIVVWLAIGGQYDRAAWYILLCVIMDKMDGTAARAFDACSSFGIEFDSFSDFFSFGVAPAILILSFFQGQFNGNMEAVPLSIKGACAVYILLTAIRLAKFNCADKEDKDFFYGLTSTQAGAMVAVLFLVARKHELWLLRDETVMSGILLLFGVLMVSTFKYRKFKKRSARWLNILQSFVFLFLALLVLFHQWPEFILAVSVLYFVGAVIQTHFERPQGTDPDHEPPA